MAIQIRRGDYDDMDANLLVDGELVATTQDDPNFKNGRGVYIKNGTLQKIITDETDTSYTLIDTITLSSASSDIELFSTTTHDYSEYIIVINGSLSGSTGGVYLSLGGVSTVSLTPNDYQNFKRAFTIKKIVDYDSLITVGDRAEVQNIQDKTISLKSSAINFASGTVIKIYAR